MIAMKKMLVVMLVGVAPVSGGDFLRELSADRPDATESPNTVEAGRFQIESSLWSYERDTAPGVRMETWVFGESNLKVGLTEDMDLQWVVRPWVREIERGGGLREGVEGFGDMDLRLKWNLWGNDGGDTAGALMPFVTVPVGTAVSGDHWEGGVVFPVAIGLSESMDLGFQVELARVRGDDGHEWECTHTVVLGRDLGNDLGVFIEYAGVFGESRYEASVFSGVTWMVGRNLRWDLACGVGLNDDAPDFSIAQGVTFRF